MNVTPKSARTIILVLIVCLTSLLSCGKEPQAELKFTFHANKAIAYGGPAGAEITAYVNPEPQGNQRKRVTFSPPIHNALNDIFLADKAALNNIYGESRGGIIMTSKFAEFADDPVTGRKYAYWMIKNPEQKFCSIPFGDAEKNEVTSILVWVE